MHTDGDRTSIKWAARMVKARIELDRLKLEQHFAKNQLLLEPIWNLIIDYTCDNPAVVDILVESDQRACDASGTIIVETNMSWDCGECAKYTFNLGHIDLGYIDNHNRRSWDWWIEDDSIWDAVFMLDKPKIVPQLDSEKTAEEIYTDPIYYSSIVMMRKHLYNVLKMNKSASVTASGPTEITPA